MTIAPLPCSAICAAEARRIRCAGTAAPAAVLVAAVPMSATSWPMTLASAVSVNLPPASVVVDGSFASLTPLPFVSMKTVAPA